MVIVRSITAVDTRLLRGEILRPGQPPANLVYPGDDAENSFHAGAFVDGALVGIATVYPEAMPLVPDATVDPENAFRLRGMATHAELQGHGVGRAVLGRCIEHVRACGADVLWCNARVNALGFYERLGFATIGDEFDIAGIGPHYVMWTDLRST